MSEAAEVPSIPSREARKSGAEKLIKGQTLNVSKEEIGSSFFDQLAEIKRLTPEDHVKKRRTWLGFGATTKTSYGPIVDDTGTEYHYTEEVNSITGKKKHILDKVVKMTRDEYVSKYGELPAGGKLTVKSELDIHQGSNPDYYDVTLNTTQKKDLKDDAEEILNDVFVDLTKMRQALTKDKQDDDEQSHRAQRAQDADREDIEEIREKLREEDLATVG